MSYVRDNGLASSRRRRERRTLAILTFCGLLMVLAVVAAAVVMSQSGKKAVACPNGTVSVPPPAQSLFVLNVYNAGGPTGAAGDAAMALHSRSFDTGTVGNDPLKKKLTDAGEIRFGPDGAGNAKLAAALVPGAHLVNDGRDGSSVDVVIGKTFPKLSAVASTSAAPRCK